MNRLVAAVSLILLLCSTAFAAPEPRIALVIGINAYQNAPPLTDPVNDAKAIGDALRRLHFDVEELDNPNFPVLTGGIRDFGIRAKQADAAVIYFAGYGMQLNSENFLLPADAKLNRTRDILYEGPSASLLLGAVSQARKIGIVLLDSCRKNPFVDRITSATGSIDDQAITFSPGLARVENLPRDTMVVMAARAGRIADDGPEHSPFAAAILARLQIPGLDLGLFFRGVHDAVLQATMGRQEPYVFSALGNNKFYFNPREPLK